MSARRMMVAALAAFALCVAAGEPCAAAQTGASDAGVPLATESGAASAAASLADSLGIPSPIADGVTVYYFHRTIRCETCLRAEALADSIVHRAFAPEVERGELDWIAVDVDRESGAHFVDKYELGLFGLVISARAGGEELYWRNLESVPDLVDYRQLFGEYVRGEVRHALDRFTGGFSEPRDTTKEDAIEDAR